jgi:hypothetical protein
MPIKEINDQLQNSKDPVAIDISDYTQLHEQIREPVVDQKKKPGEFAILEFTDGMEFYLIVNEMDYQSFINACACLNVFLETQKIKAISMQRPAQLDWFIIKPVISEIFKNVLITIYVS